MGQPDSHDTDRPTGRLRPAARWLLVTVAGALVVAVVGTVYATRGEDAVERLVVGERELTVQTLGPGEFNPSAMVFSGAVVVPGSGPTAEDVPADALTLQDYDRYLLWALENGGVAADTLPLQVTIRARTDDPVRLNGFVIEDLERSAPVEGWYRYPDVGCGVVPVRHVVVDLDDDRPRPLLVDEAGAAPRPMTDVYEVTSTEAEVFEIHASTTTSDARFRLSVRYQGEHGSGTQPIGDFRVTAITDQQAYDLTDWTDPDATLEPVDRSGPIGC